MFKRLVAAIGNTTVYLLIAICWLFFAILWGAMAMAHKEWSNLLFSVGFLCLSAGNMLTWLRRKYEEAPPDES